MRQTMAIVFEVPSMIDLDQDSCLKLVFAVAAVQGTVLQLPEVFGVYAVTRLCNNILSIH